jgi:hypothetical protein
MLMRFLRLDVNGLTPGNRWLRVIASRIGLACLLIASIFCAGVRAQSGRRVRAGEKAGTPQPAPVIVPETAEPAKPKRILPKVMLIVGGRIDNKSDRADTIFNAFVIRLGQSMQTNSLGLVKHEEAEKRARAETENYVVWLEIERDNYGQGRVIFNSLDYTVKYSVLAPRTAEVKAKGRVYYQGMGGARTRTDQSSVVKNTPEDAGQTAAEMVLDWLAVLAAQAK